MEGKRKPTHPGYVFNEDVIKPLGLTVTEAAKRLGITRKALSELINGHAALSPDMAIRIGKATDTSPESWLQMQVKLDLWNAAQREHNVTAFGPTLSFQNI
jgi:addiction module HigA family antidote